ncbi:MAG: pilus assembly protein TadG-related protein [Novosphingobium sp.]|nr:pilus assembly protein TadG-related protein [Novosphingobium sp.]
MFDQVKRFARSLRRDTGGNTMMLFALGMPVFVGGAGLAVDTAQWYQWHREMQFAVDQAAMAGAWSRVGGSTGDEYKTRAEQEIDANLQVVDFEAAPTVNLANYAGGTNNSVLVTLSATKTLPFSSMLTGSGTTISVSAQAAFEKGRTFTACLIAVDPDTPGAISIGGSAFVTSNCGAAALSNNEEAITMNGNPTFDVGYLVAAGGIDDDFDSVEDLEIFENQAGLIDPFADLAPPDNPTPRTYECTSAGTRYEITYSDRRSVEEWTYRGNSPTNMRLESTSVLSTGTTSGLTKEGDRHDRVGDVILESSTVTNTGTVTQSGNRYYRTDTVETRRQTITAVEEQTTVAGASLQPGTYSDLRVSCNTTMAKGVYVIDGGLFKINATDSVIGQGVMIVLKNGAGIELNGGAALDLRAMTTDEMVTYAGLTTTEALKLKDMLIFEDPTSSGRTGNSVNGTAGAILDGAVYLPKSDITFNGSFEVVSRCLVIAANTITIQGDANMTSFCPVGVTNTVSVGGGVTAVKLVA